MRPQEISRFWLRRLCEVVFFSCTMLIVLYSWARFIPTGYELPIGMSISDIAAATAATGSLISLVLCFWPPRRNLSLIAALMYLLLVGIFSVAIFTSGGLGSPFIATWFALAIFAGFFGMAVMLVMITLVIAQIIITAISDGTNLQIILTNLFFGLTPLVASFILWSRKRPRKEERYLTDLQHKLSTVEGKSDVVINTIDDGVMAISREGIIELINPSAQNLIGWKQGDALGLSWKSVLVLVDEAGKKIADRDNPVAQALTTNKPAHSDKLFLLTSSERRRLVSIVSSPVGANGEGVIVVFRDITEEKAKEREQSEFISTASHEMRTPVASIEGYLGLALNPATANIDEKARNFITKAHESAQHLGRLFQDLLDISKAEDGRLKNEPRVINVNEFTKEIFDGLAHKANEKNLTYTFKPESVATGSERTLQPIFYAFADADHLREILDNLIENAIKYTPDGEVVVDITENEKYITISIKDNGIGIPAEDLPHLFQKFYRVDNSDTREIGGTGLGLYLSRRLAENMSGNIRVESKYKEGSTFFLDIPRLSNDEARQKLEEAAAIQPTEIIPPETQERSTIAAVPTQPDAIAAQTSETTPLPPPAEPLATPVILPTETPTMMTPKIPAPTLTEIEQQLSANRDQLLVPERKKS